MFPSHNEERGEEAGSGKGKGRKKRAGEKGRATFFGAAEERLTRKRKTELGEILDLRVKGCLGGVNRVNESVTRRGRREEERREGRREGHHHGEVAAGTVSVQVIRGLLSLLLTEENQTGDSLGVNGVS